ncbi:MAG: hypothetical protein D8M57_18460 [Candidatus Scalindua sp. AMX11]|nr:MAG: hypothetical protein DWQ00_04485 [Candidatus Scalindua sp.]TDE63402.1 MAG: hypothetical protein D8M57_18460 [Candidatus Scalindua sp. AMX11]
MYRSTLLRESYRENGKVKKRTVANIYHRTPGGIAAIKLALKHKDDLSELGSLKESVALQEGLSVGAVRAVQQTAKKLGIEKALGTSFAGKLALWTAITKPQIRPLIKTGVIQIELFDKEVCEVEENGIRHVLRHHPIHADKMAQTLLSKRQCIENFLQSTSD